MSAPASTTQNSAPTQTAGATAASALEVSAQTLVQAAKIALEKDCPIMLDYYRQTAGGTAFLERTLIPRSASLSNQRMSLLRSSRSSTRWAMILLFLRRIRSMLYRARFRNVRSIWHLFRRHMMRRCNTSFSHKI